MQLTKGLIDATVTLSGANAHDMNKVIAELEQLDPITVGHSLLNVHQTALTFNVSRHPVWGNWPDDLRKDMTRAIKNAGVEVNFNIDSIKRTITERRSSIKQQASDQVKQHAERIAHAHGLQLKTFLLDFE